MQVAFAFNSRHPSVIFFRTDVQEILRVQIETSHRKDQTLHAIDFEATRSFMSSYFNTSHDDLMALNEEEKRETYHNDCRDNGAVFMPFVMDVISH